MSQTGLEQKDRERWGSRTGFILATVGSAVGLGNIWGFSYQLGTSGGAAFLLIYLLCVVLIGYPIVMAEFTIGRKSQSDAVGSFQKLAPGKPWFIAGVMGVWAAIIIMSFYPVIAGWVLKYFYLYLTGGLSGDMEENFGAFVGTSEPIIWHFIFMVVTVGVVLLGVKKGLEKANKILMPTLFLLLVGLAIYSLSLGGAKDALTFMFTPTWESFATAEVWVRALGQAFFSLSLGMGALITYSSYLGKDHKLPSAAASVVSLDTLVAIVAGLMIFPAVFAFNQEPDQSVGLVFMTMPNIFEYLGTVGMIVGIFFFFLLGVAALSSAISLVEVPVSYFMRQLNWSRKKTTLAVGAVIYVVGIPLALATGPLSNIELFGKGLFDLAEYLSFNVLLPLGGAIISLFIGWGWNKVDVLKASDFGESTIGTIWLFILRWVAPIFIFIIFLQSSGILKL